MTRQAGQAGDRYRAGKRLWSVEDDATLTSRYPHEPTAALARELRRSVNAIYARADILGLNKSAAYLASPDACRLRRGDNVGAPTRFKKGQVPLNKGLRRPGWGPGRMKQTQFVKGARNGVAARRWMPVGSTRLVDGYVYRKVADTPSVPWTKNWTPDHVLGLDIGQRADPDRPCGGVQERRPARHSTRQPGVHLARPVDGAQLRAQPPEAARRHDPVTRRAQPPDPAEDERP